MGLSYGHIIERSKERSELLKKKWSNQLLPFHIVYGGGDGAVSILIRKSIPVYLYRLIRFGETSRFVHDSRGKILVYNHIEQVDAILNREHKIYGQYHSSIRGHGVGEEWTTDEYNEAYADLKYGTGKNAKTDAQMIKDPYCHWVKGYKAHFILEKPFEKRIHHAYYCPLEDWFK